MSSPFVQLKDVGTGTHVESLQLVKDYNFSSPSRGAQATPVIPIIPAPEPIDTTPSITACGCNTNSPFNSPLSIPITTVALPYTLSASSTSSNSTTPADNALPNIPGIRKLVAGPYLNIMTKKHDYQLDVMSMTIGAGTVLFIWLFTALIMNHSHKKDKKAYSTAK